MNKELENLAIEQIRDLAREAYKVVCLNNQNMGQFATRATPFDELCTRLNAIENWADALLKVGRTL